MKLTLEKEIESKLVKAIEKRGGLCLKWVSPGRSGVPDRIILCPGGVVVFAELKRPKGGVISPLQRWWQQQLAKLGFWMVFIRDEDSLDTLLLNIDDDMARRRNHGYF